MLSIKNLTVTLDTHQIINNVSLDIAPGSLHALMGPNGSGKSTLAQVIMGHPRYSVANGEITYGDTPITTLTPDKRAHLGIFVAVQHPYELPGVTVIQFLHHAYQARHGTIEITQFKEQLSQLCVRVGLEQSSIFRAVNDGFSGGEKKRLEMLQMLVLKPSLIILDEIDSGLDVDGLALVAQAVADVRAHNPHVSIIIITHYQRLFTHLHPDFVHIMHQGSLIQSGDHTLIAQLEQTGYQPFMQHEKQGSSRGISV